ncbi:MAG: M42 family metallopeptidase [Spirochaetales bacterium]|nr:M42 family metallopeptidase [Spirochaetales bacterium]
MDLQRLKRICDLGGVSGFEDDVVLYLQEELKKIGPSSIDSMLNLYVHRTEANAGDPVVMLDAHTDEVGFMVRLIRPNGLIEFTPVGGWVTSNIPAHQVLVRTVDGTYITGIVGSKPPHYMSESERTQAPVIENLYIDIGVSSRREADELGVRTGNPIVPRAELEFKDDEIIFGKAFDDRLGCVAIVEILEALRGETLSVNPVGVFSSQEEVGLRGAQVAAHTLKPDVAICFEGTPADDTFESADRRQTALGMGPMLRYIDSKMITNPRFQRFALEVAKKYDIPVQTAVRTGGATNAGAIHLSGGGVPSIVIGVPVRYAHTHYSVASLADLQGAIALGRALLKELDSEVIASF